MQRHIRPETAARFSIYTGKAEDGGVVPSAMGNVIAFPYFENGRVVAEKYRQLPKKFWQREGGKRVFWNAEAIELAAGGRLIITEGEVDALTAIDCGLDVTVSVPDGAPPEEVDIDTDRDGGKFSYLWEARKHLEAVKTFVIAVDGDEPGRLLASELVRRLSAARCKFVEYPEGCKDLNEVHVKHGAAAVVALLDSARDYPLRGMYRLSEYPERPPLQLCSTGWAKLDRLLKPFPGALMVITGVPGHGKSSFACHLISNMCDANGWSAAVFSPEMPVVPHLRQKLRRIHVGQFKSYFDQLTVDEERLADEWIEHAFVFLDADPSGDWNADERTLDWVLQKATEAVQKFGVRILLIDPWNEIEHWKRKDELTTEYIGRGIRELRRFAQQRDVLVIIVAHPTKEILKEKRAPGLYDIDGSAHWANKPDFGVSIHRPKDLEITNVIVGKVRFGDTGRNGTVAFSYDTCTHRYSETVREREGLP